MVVAMDRGHCDDYEVFLGWRQARLWQETQRMIGLAQATDPRSGDPRSRASHARAASRPLRRPHSSRRNRDRISPSGKEK